MLDLEVYFDDSGTHSNTSVAVAACYISNKSQWDEFDRNWKDILREEDLEYFHTADFFNANRRPYSEWDHPKRTKFLKRMISTINLRTKIGLAIAIPKLVYDEFAPERYKQTYAKDHYTFAVKCCMGLIWEWRTEYNISEPMKYAFDNVNKGPSRVREQIGNIWSDFETDPQVREKYGITEMDGWLFQSKKSFTPLQAADVLAWHMYDYMVTCVEKGKGKLYDARPSFLQLRDGRPIKLGWFTGPQLVDYFQQMDELEKKYSVDLDVTRLRRRPWLRKLGAER